MGVARPYAPNKKCRMRWGVVRKKLSPDCSMVVRLLGCLLWVLLGSSVFACFLLCLCVCLAGLQCKECQSRLSCRIPWRINMNSPPFVMASNWRQISGRLLLSNETYVFSAHAKFLSDPNPRWEWRDLTPPNKKCRMRWDGWSGRSSPQTDQSGESSS